MVDNMARLINIEQFYYTKWIATNSKIARARVNKYNALVKSNSNYKGVK